MNREYDIEIGTGVDESLGIKEPTASIETVEVFKNVLISAGFNVEVNKYFKGARGGTIIRTFYRKTNSSYLVEAFQMECSTDIRRNPEKLYALGNSLCEAIEKYCDRVFKQ